MSSLKRLIHELQRRRVYRVAVVDAVIAFVIYQPWQYLTYPSTAQVGLRSHPSNGFVRRRLERHPQPQPL